MQEIKRITPFIVPYRELVLSSVVSFGDKKKLS
jgi:hypothetical protein